jgi:hypothetical protein
VAREWTTVPTRIEPLRKHPYDVMSQNSLTRMWRTIAFVPPVPDIMQDVCLIHCFRALGIKVPYLRSGPLWALSDGRELLLPFGKSLMSISPSSVAHMEPGKYVLGSAHHFYALKVFTSGCLLYTGVNTRDCREVAILIVITK